MDIVNDVSPYWCSDPRTAQSNRDRVAEWVLDEKDVPVNLVYSLPSTQIPVVSPDAYGAERRRLVSCMILPFPYLPDDVWMRRPGEPLGGWQMRLIVALDAMGLLNVEGSNVFYRSLDDVPDDLDETADMITAFDGNASNALLDSIRMDMLKRLDKVWPDGYPIRDMVDMGHDLAVLGMRASPVLGAHRAVALNAAGDSKGAVDLLKALQQSYGSLFDPKDMTPNGVMDWVKANRGRVTDLTSRLVQWGLEAQKMADMMERILSQEV